MSNYSGYQFHIAASYGLAAHVKALKEGVIGYDIDTKTFRVGDGTSTPPRIMTDKSSGSFIYDYVSNVKFNTISLFDGKKIDGVDPSTMVQEAGFPYHISNGAFKSVLLASSNDSVTIGAPYPDPTNSNRYLVNLGIKQEYLDILLSGFNLSNVETLDTVPTELGDPIIYVNETYYIWNSETNSYNTLGIPVFTDVNDFPTIPGPNLYIDATDTNDHKLRMWSGTAYVFAGGGNEVLVAEMEPNSPPEGMWWKKPSTNEVKARIDQEWLTFEFSSDTSPNALSRKALFESWRLNDEGYLWENFVNNPQFNQREFNAMAVTTTAGDDTLVVPSSYPFTVGASYAIFTADGLVEDVTILNKPSETTVRVTTTIGTTLNTIDNAKIGPSSFDIKDGYAEVKGNSVYYARNISVLNSWNKGIVLIRRDALGTGLYSVYYRISGTDTWIKASMLRSQGVKHDPLWSEELYSINVNRANYDVKIVYSGEEEVVEKIKYIVFYTDPEQADDLRVDRPYNVTPAQNAVDITETPTLTLSAFRSLYGIAQGGARFQVSNDETFYDVVVDTSTEPLISWIAVAGETAEFTDAIMYDDKKAVVVGEAAFIATTDDGGATFTSRTSAIATENINAVAYNGLNLFYAVGDSGGAQHSADGITWVQAAGVDSFAGDLYGVAATGSYGIAVGTSGKILTTTNNGVIWASATQAGSFSGTFYSVCMLENGRAIAVGSGGTIQTSPDYGVTWVARTKAGAFVANFLDVAMNADGYAVIVGEDGEIQTSSDFGSTWTARTAADSYVGDFQEVEINDETVIAVGTSGCIQTSYNLGQTWFTRPAASSSTATFKGIGFNYDNYAFIVGAGGAVQHTLLLEGAVGASFTVPSGLDLLTTNKVYYWRGKYQDEIGYWSEWSEHTAFATQSVFQYVGQPSNVLPANNAISVALQPNLVSSAFSSSETNPDTHASSQWQISTTPDFTSTVYDSGSSSDLITHTVASALTAFSTLYWRVRHYGTASGAGPWSIPTTFRTSSVPNAPTITSPTNSATGVSISPLLQTSAFFNVDPGITHYASQFQISTSAVFATIAYDSGTVTVTPLTQHSVPSTTLAGSTVYYVRARHKGPTTDWSSWSSAISFTTSNLSVNKPIFSYTGLTVSAVTLKSNAFSITGTGGTDSHASSDWEIYKVSGATSTLVWSAPASSSKTSITVNKGDLSGGALTSGEYYKARVRHNGTNLGASSWSDYNTGSNFSFPDPTGTQEFNVPGTYSFVVPPNVYSICVALVAGGRSAQQGPDGNYIGGGGGGDLGYKNNVSVTPGQVYNVYVGAANAPSYFSGNGINFYVNTGIVATLSAILTRSTSFSSAYPWADGGGFGGFGGRPGFGQHLYSVDNTIGGGGGAAGRWDGNGGNGASSEYTSSPVTIPAYTIKSWVLTSTTTSGPSQVNSPGVALGYAYSINSDGSSTALPVGSTRADVYGTFLNSVYNGVTATSGKVWNATATYNYTLSEQTVPASQGSNSNRVSVAPTGIIGFGRGGAPRLAGEGINLDGSNRVGNFGAGGGMGVYMQPLNGQNGAVRVIWGSGKSFPSNV